MISLALFYGATASDHWTVSASLEWRVAYTGEHRMILKGKLDAIDARLPDASKHRLREDFLLISEFADVRDYACAGAIADAAMMDAALLAFKATFKRQTTGVAMAALLEKNALRLSERSKPIFAESWTLNRKRSRLKKGVSEFTGGRIRIQQPVTQPVYACLRLQ